MAMFAGPMPSFAENTPPQPSSPSQLSTAQTKPGNGAPPKPPQNGCTDVKPRLTKEQHDILEAHFQQQHKPSTITKKGFAESLGVPVDKINNWFQNRRAKVKQDQKKQLNQYNMNMGLYGTAQIPIVTSQFPPHSEQQQPQPQQPMSQDFYPANADISPTCLPVQSIEGPPALDLSSQMSLHQRYDMHALRSIPEGDRTTYNPNDLMQSIMAAQAGPSYMQNHPVTLPSQEPGFPYDTSGLPQEYSTELAYSMPNTLPNESAPSNGTFNGDFPGLDYTLVTTNLSGPADAQNSAGSLSSEHSPFSGTQSTATTQSSGGPNSSSVNSLASVFSNWTNPRQQSEFSQGNEGEDSFDAPYNLPQASASDHTLSYWGSSGHPPAFSQGDMYQHTNASAQAVLSSPEHEDQKPDMSQVDIDALPNYGDDVYSRRNSSTTNLASNIEAIHIQNSHTPDGFKQPSTPSTIAARRQKRPTALNSTTLRSSSYTTGMPSPGANNEHTLRRIRSSGIPNATGRIQKPTPGSAQRSPMTMTFAEAAASPKFARTFSSSSTTTIGQGGSLAPPTPLTPNEMGRFPYWQANTVMRGHAPMPEHSSSDSLNASHSMEPPESLSITASPPSTPLDLGQWNQSRLGSDSLYRDTPPQSAPATQQSFPRTAFVPPPLMRAGFHSTSDLTIAQPKPSHFRRPSLPDTGHGQMNEPHMQYPVQLNDLYDGNFGDMSLNGITHNVPFAPPSCMPEFLVHEFSPPQGGGPGSLLRRITEPAPKNYIFANQGPGDFR